MFRIAACILEGKPQPSQCAAFARLTWYGRCFLQGWEEQYDKYNSKDTCNLFAVRERATARGQEATHPPPHQTGSREGVEQVARLGLHLADVVAAAIETSDVSSPF